MMFAALAIFLALPSAAAPAACVTAGSLPALLDQAEAMPAAERRGLDVAGFLTPSVYYYACRGVADNDAAACGELSGFTLRIPGARSLEWNCRQRWSEALFTRALIRRDPKASGVCAEFVRGQFGVSDGPKTKALCENIIRGGAGADDALCREVMTASGREATDLRLEGCRGALKIYRGEQTDCEALSGKDYLAADLALCRAVRAFRQTEAGGGPAACGDQALCRALAGAGAATCEPYAAQAQKVFAARIQKPDEKEPASPGPTGAPRLALADDVFPQVPAFAASSPKAEAGAAEAPRGAFPSFENGVLSPPNLYDTEKRFSAADRERLAAALRAAHQLADINAAYQEGYRALPTSGAEIRMTRVEAGAVPATEKPSFAAYAADGRGRWRLIRVGWLWKGENPPSLFDSPEAKWTRRDGPEPLWILSAWLPIYNAAGLFAEKAPKTIGTRSFYGASAEGSRRAARPVCRP